MTINVGEVRMIDIGTIFVGDRVRQEMGDLDGLEANMKESGLISPLAVMDNFDGTYQLLAGERRYTVLHRHNGAGTQVPVRIYDKGLSEIEIKVIEKSENFYRKDMEWWEYDLLVKQIHDLQQAIHGEKAPGPGQSGWGTKETAEMIGLSQGMISPAILRAEAREQFPELFESCKSAADATKVLKKIGEEAIKEALAQKIQAASVDTDLSRIASRFIIKDCFEGIKGIPDGVMHLVEIDPPYSINLASQKRKDGESQYSLDEYNEISPDRYEDMMPRLFKECHRVMSDHSWLICWFAPHPWFEKMYQWIKGSGFGTTRLCGIWTKGTPGQSMNPTTRLANSYEMFFYAWKGQPALNKAGRGNDFHFPPVPSQQKVHPTERPIELMEEIYATFAFTGSRVLIPFLGSGNGLLAAHKLGMQGVGFELSKSYKDSFIVKAHSLFSR